LIHFPLNSLARLTEVRRANYMLYNIFFYTGGCDFIMASVSLSDNSDSVISGMPFDGEKDSLSADVPSRLRRICLFLIWFNFKK
jgi:hypothetical protein